MHITRVLIITAIAFFTLPAVYGQGFKSRFETAFKEKDTTGQLRILNEWQKAAPKDAELFIGWYNYYVRKSRVSTVAVEPQRKDSTSVELMDSTGKVVGYLNAKETLDTAILHKGFTYIDKGIALYPNRLDMRFGKTFMLEKAEEYNTLADELVKAVETGAKIKMKWKWQDGKPLPGAEDVFFNNLQSYINTIYATGNDYLLPNIRLVSETVLKYYPDNAVSLSNLALTYIVPGENDKALEYLLKAEKLNPKDIVTINNIAEIYTRKGNYLRAREYYEKMSQYGTAEDKAYAQKKIDTMD